MTESADQARSTQTPRITIAWLLVGIPLAYGIFNIVKATLPLFGG